MAKITSCSFGIAEIQRGWARGGAELEGRAASPHRLYPLLPAFPGIALGSSRQLLKAGSTHTWPEIAFLRACSRVWGPEISAGLAGPCGRAARPNLEAGGGTEVAAFLRAAPASLKLAELWALRWAPQQCRGSRSSLLLCVAQGLPAESHLDGVELILNLLKAGFSGSAGLPSPRLVMLLALPQFP